jgi:BirA family biotin operon repressor/biotin-[acetyl-CoA-carboxylase] ligase
MPHRRSRLFDIPSVKPIVHRFETVDSTQEQARRLLRIGEATAGHVILAEEQRAGRGRFGRSWSSPRGGFYASFVIEPRQIPSIVAGLAVGEALDGAGLRTRLKWPNDVTVEGRKIAGVLIESAGRVLIVGIGVNVDEAPIPQATSARAWGVRIDRDRLVEELWRALHAPVAVDEALHAYRARCETIGQFVRLVHGRGTAFEGVAVGVDAEGRLVVQSSSGRRSFASADFEHVEKAVDENDWRS